MEDQEPKMTPQKGETTVHQEQPSPMPKMDTEPPQSPEPSSHFTPPSLKTGLGFRIFVILSLIIVAAIYGGVVYLYSQNQKIKKGETSENINSNLTPTSTPTPSFSPDQVKIKNGSVVREIPGETTILVDKENYDSTGITGFAKVVVSPDETKICFESWPPAPEPALYIADIDGSEVSEVSPNRQNCVWVPDSQKIMYVNSSSKTTPANIYLFSPTDEVETNLTKDSVSEGTVRRYEIVGFSADGGKIICTYEDVGGTDEGMGGECEIDLSTLAVNFL